MAGKKKEAKFDPNKYPMGIANNSIQKSSRVRITGDAGSSFNFTTPMPYQPEFASPERVQWPIDRLQQNRYWRLFCFVPGTPVVLSDGTRKNIEDFKIGDLVITHKNNTRKVTNTFEHLINEEVYKIYISGQHDPLIVTGEHPFLINTEKNKTNIKWENARDIREDNELLSLIPEIENDYIRHIITKIEKIQYEGPVYNIEVEEDNTYLVGQLACITHNCKTDPVISTVIDLYAEIIASDFTVAGEGVDGEIKDTYDYMIEKTNIISAFKYFVSEYLILGEVIPHLVFDDKKGIWTSLIFHNPDQIKVIDSQFISMEPILEFTPDETLRALARSTNPSIIKFISKLPPEVQEAIISGRNIPLDTSLNATFLARKIHPYEARGTSIFTRLYRILMYEDGIMNASLATARRHAGPLKIAKLGDKDLRWVPEQSYQDKIMQLLTVAEQDPHSFLILPWFVNFEAFGTTDKMMNVGREWDIIERIKLTALGVSQGFIHGEATYACFVKNTEISTDYGIYKPIQDIKIGELVIDKDGQIQEVTNAWQSQAPETLTQIELWGGKTLTSTTNHKYPVWAWPRKCGCGECNEDIKAGRNYVTGHNNPKFSVITVGARTTIGRQQSKGILENYNPYQTLEASQIHDKDYLMIPRKFDEISLPKNITLDHAKLLGFYVAEGSYLDCNKKNNILWTFNIKERDTYAKEVLDAGKNLNMYFTCVDRLEHNVCYVHAYKQAYDNFYSWLYLNGGRYSHGKKLSAEVMRYPLEFKEELIKAMFKGDGSCKTATYIYKKENRKVRRFSVRYVTVSKVLADQICIILAQLGIYAAISKIDNKKRNEKEISQRRDAYLIQAYSTNAQKLAKLVWNEDVELNKNSRPQTWIDDNYVYVPVRSIKTIKNADKTPVYNLTIAGDHSYLAEGFGTYNSMKGNLQTLLMRLNGLRQYFVSSWFIPKFFRPIAEMNKWVKKDKKSAPIKNNFRRNSSVGIGDEEDYIIPDIQWSRSLDSKTDSELMDTYEQLINRLGIPLSKKTVFPAAGVDYEAEMKNLAEEKLDAEKLAKEMGVSEQTLTGKEPEVAPSGGGAGGAPAAEEGAEESIPLTPIEEGVEETAPEATPAGASKKTSFWKEKLLAQEKLQKEAETKIRAGEVKDLLNDDIFTELVDLIKTGKSSPYWKSILKKGEDSSQFSKNFDWDRLSDFLDNDGFKEYHIEGIRQELIRQEVIDPSREDKLRELVSGLSPDNDEQLGKVIDQVISSGDPKVAEKVNSLFLGPVNAAKSRR